AGGIRSVVRVGRAPIARLVLVVALRASAIAFHPWRELIVGPLRDRPPIVLRRVKRVARQARELGAARARRLDESVVLAARHAHHAVRPERVLPEGRGPGQLDQPIANGLVAVPGDDARVFQVRAGTETMAPREQLADGKLRRRLLDGDAVALSAHLGRSASAKLARVDHRRSAGPGASLRFMPGDMRGARTVARLA